MGCCGGMGGGGCMCGRLERTDEPMQGCACGRHGSKEVKAEETETAESGKHEHPSMGHEHAHEHGHAHGHSHSHEGHGHAHEGHGHLHEPVAPKAHGCMCGRH